MSDPMFSPNHHHHHLVYIVHVDLDNAEVGPEHGGLGPVEQLLVQHHAQTLAVPEVHHQALVRDPGAEIVRELGDAEHPALSKYRIMKRSMG